MSNYLILHCIVLSGIILFPIPFLKRNQEERQKSSEYQTEMGIMNDSHSGENLSS